MTIKETSQLTGVTADTLRYYERIGLIPPVPRNDNGIRNYDEISLGWINFIKCMRAAGLPVEALIEYVTLYKGGSATDEARRQILIEQRDILEQKVKALQDTLEKLNFKIDNYDKLMRHEISEMTWGK